MNFMLGTGKPDEVPFKVHVERDRETGESCWIDDLGKNYGYCFLGEPIGLKLIIGENKCKK
jgi:hypothetical protein